MVLICASLMEETVDEFQKAAENISSDLIEVRADGLTHCSIENVHNLLKKLKKTTDTPLILTVRKRDEGGRFKGSEEERKNIILGSLHLADLVDIELRSSIREEIVQRAQANKIEVIISYHDFDKTPSKKEINEVIMEEISAGADYAKVAFRANSLHDVLTLLSATEQMSKKGKIIALSMGELGRVTRVVGPVFGSMITYAAAGRKTAPGQLTIEETQQVLDMLELKDD